MSHLGLTLAMQRSFDALTGHSEERPTQPAHFHSHGMPVCSTFNPNPRLETGENGAK